MQPQEEDNVGQIFGRHNLLEAGRSRARPVIYATRDETARDQLDLILDHMDEIAKRTGGACDERGPCSMCRRWASIRAVALEIFE